MPFDDDFIAVKRRWSHAGPNVAEPEPKVLRNGHLFGFYVSPCVGVVYETGQFPLGFGCKC